MRISINAESRICIFFLKKTLKDHNHNAKTQIIAHYDILIITGDNSLNVEIFNGAKSSTQGKFETSEKNKHLLRKCDLRM